MTEAYIITNFVLCFRYKAKALKKSFELEIFNKMDVKLLFVTTSFIIFLYKLQVKNVPDMFATVTRHKYDIKQNELYDFVTYPDTMDQVCHLIFEINPPHTKLRRFPIIFSWQISDVSRQIDILLDKIKILGVN